jgi:DNA-binding MarR family transcriptional regulator
MTVKSKEQIIDEIHKMGLVISKNIQQRGITTWIDLDLTMSQLKSLLYINYQENVCIKDLSKILNIAQPNVTTLIDYLVKQELVTRAENLEDRRKLVLRTTPKAKKLISGLRDSLWIEISGQLMQLSLEHLEMLGKGLKPLAEVMEKYPP